MFANHLGVDALPATGPTIMCGLRSEYNARPVPGIFLLLRLDRYAIMQQDTGLIGSYCPI